MNATNPVIGGEELQLPGILPPAPMPFPKFEETVYSSNGKYSGSTCPGPVIPGGTTVRVKLVGAWDIYDKEENRKETGISVIHSSYPTSIHISDPDSKSFSGYQDYTGNETFTSPNRFKICVKVPTPPSGGSVKVTDGNAVRIVVSDVRDNQ